MKGPAARLPFGMRMAIHVSDEGTPLRGSHQALAPRRPGAELAAQYRRTVASVYTICVYNGTAGQRERWDMSWRSALARPVRWLRAGYPDGAPDRGYSPLLALMPAKAPDGENPPDADRPPAPHASRARAEAEKRWRA
jgi:hypothetical protein